MTFKSYRQESRVDWGRSDANPTMDEIKTGAIFRIADACELMAKNHAQLIDERDRYKRWYDQKCEQNYRLERRINSLRGVITRMKKAKP